MNERIRELFDQTIKQFNEEHKDAPYRAMFIVPDPVKEKFAELIVRECAQVASDWVNEPTMLSIKNKIKWHFGVE
jgi:hypothetical protein